MPSSPGTLWLSTPGKVAAMRELLVILLSFLPVVLSTAVAIPVWLVTAFLDPTWRASLTFFFWIAGFGVSSQIFWRAVVTIQGAREQV